MKFTIDKAIYDKVSPLHIGVLVLERVNNTADISEFVQGEYAKIAGGARAKFEGAELSEYPVIRRWRDIYKGFGEKKARSSIEALIRRVVNGKDLYAINPLVDLYNLASLKFELPCGGEDIDAMDADLTLAFATGKETFIPLGAAEAEHPNEGEILYKCGDTVVCRNFNYRESDLTKLTENTQNAIIVFENAGGGEETTWAALRWVGGKAEELLGARIVETAILDESNREISW